MPIPVAALLLLQAQSPEPAAAPVATDEIVVTGVRESTLDLKRMLRAQAEFDRHRAALGPNATLYFVLSDRPGRPAATTRLTLRDGRREVAVPVDAAGRFTLSDLPKGRWELWHDRGGAAVAVRALVLSPGSSEQDRRLGDARLQCRASWILLKPLVSFVQRTAFDTVGGCGSTRFALYFQTRRPVADASVADGARVLPLEVRQDGGSVRMPLADRTLANDARVRLTYR